MATSDRQEHVPTWDMNPSTLQLFESKVEWYASGMKLEDRKLAAARIIGKMIMSGNGTLRAWASGLKTRDFEFDGGHHLMLQRLRQSPLGKLAITDAGHKIKRYYKNFARRSGELMGPFLIREEQEHTNMLSALARLIEEMQKTKQRTCAQCGGLFPGNQVSDWKGVFWCKQCWPDTL